MQPASVSSRFAALHLDCIVYLVICQAFVLLLEKFTPQLATVPVFIGVNALLWVLYFVYPLTRSGQTLGKKLLSLKVVHRYDDRQPLSWGQAFQRELVGKTLSGLAFGLGYLWAYTNEDRNTWHDSMSRTEVVSLILDEEKTSAQKLQHIALAILMIPAGLGLIFGTLLYTSMPLDSIRQQMEARGIQVGSITGSLGGGLHFSEIRRDEPVRTDVQNFHLKSVEVKFSFWSLFFEKTLFIDRLSAEEGVIEVPAEFAWLNVFTNVLAMGDVAVPQGGLSIGRFMMGKLQIKNVEFQHQKKVLSRLEELSLKGLVMGNKELLISELQFQIPGFRIKAQDFKSADGKLSVSSSTGGLGPEVFPLLKVPTDFHVKGSVGKTPQETQLEGGMTIDKIKATYEAGKLQGQVDQLLLNEMFKTTMPLDGLDMKLQGQGESVKDIMSSLSLEYSLKVCGNEFKPDAQKILRFEHLDSRFAFTMLPKPVPDFNAVAFGAEATLEDLFTYQLQGARKSGTGFASYKEMWADLCFHKPLSGLTPEELENITLWENTVAGKIAKPVKPLAEAPVVAKTAPKVAPSPVAQASPSPTPEAATSSAVRPTENPEAEAPAPAGSPSPSPSPTISPTVSPAPTVNPAPTVAPETGATNSTAAPAVAAAAEAATDTVLAETAELPAPKEETEASPSADKNTEKSTDKDADKNKAAVKKPAPPKDPPATPEAIREALSQAKNLLRQGKLTEARSALDGVMVNPGVLPEQEYGAFYNVKGWVYLYLNQMSLAAQSFEWAFEARKDIGDAEGLLRSHESMKNEKEVQKWTDYIKGALKENPALRNQLSPNMKNRLFTEDAPRGRPRS